MSLDILLLVGGEMVSTAQQSFVFVFFEMEGSSVSVW